MPAGSREKWRICLRTQATTKPDESGADKRKTSRTPDWYNQINLKKKIGNNKGQRLCGPSARTVRTDGPSAWTSARADGPRASSARTAPPSKFPPLRTQCPPLPGPAKIPARFRRSSRYWVLSAYQGPARPVKIRVTNRLQLCKCRPTAVVAQFRRCCAN